MAVGGTGRVLVVWAVILHGAQAEQAVAAATQKSPVAAEQAGEEAIDEAKNTVNFLPVDGAADLGNRAVGASVSGQALEVMRRRTWSARAGSRPGGLGR